MIEFTLPLPCSVNELYTVARGRKMLSKKGRHFKRELTILVIMNANHFRNVQSKKFPIKGRIRVEYHFKFPDNRKRDQNNYIKQIADALVNGGLIEDDNQIDNNEDFKLIEKGAREVRVVIKEIECES